MKCVRCKSELSKASLDNKRCEKCGYIVNNYDLEEDAKKEKQLQRKKRRRRNGCIVWTIILIALAFGGVKFYKYAKSGDLSSDIATYKERAAEKKEQKRIEKEEKAQRKAEEDKKEKEEKMRIEAEEKVKAEMEKEEKEKERKAKEELEKEKRKQEEFSKKYKVGKFGEGGGIIFYDKGEYLDGWRFLEASTTDVGYSYWCPKEYREGYIGGLMNGLGNGYENTMLIIDKFGPETAAGIANSYHNKGFEDWYLPNRDEMALCYEVLGQEYYKKLEELPGWAHVRGKGGFFDDYVFYWTSELAGAGNAYMVDCSGKHSGEIKDTVMYDTDVLLGLTATPIHSIRAIRRF